MNSIIVFKNLNNSNKEDNLKYLLSSIQGFFISISLNPDHNSSLQDILRLLRTLFKYGTNLKVKNEFMNCMNLVSIDTWLSIIPQLIARI